MTEKEHQRIGNLLAAIRELTPGQITWLENTVRIFRFPYNFEIFQDGLLDASTLENFGDALRIHHSFSVEPFSKDKFEYVLEKVVNFDQHRAQLSSKGNPGHDITIDGVPVSLKTQADKSIKEDTGLASSWNLEKEVGVIILMTSSCCETGFSPT